MAQSADLKAKIEGLNKVFQFYYKENFKTLRKATDFYIPWFIGRKKRLEEFQKQYIPFSVALFLEGVRNSTLKMEGEPNEELIEALRAKLLHKSFKPDFDEYWNVIESTLERNPENPKEVSDAVSALLMFKLYGPKASEPMPGKTGLSAPYNRLGIPSRQDPLPVFTRCPYRFRTPAQIRSLIRNSYLVPLMILRF